MRGEGRRRHPPAAMSGQRDAPVRDRHRRRRFRQGPNELRVCAADFAPEATANHTCETRTVRIDNACPISGHPGSVLRARFKGAGGRMTAPSNEPTTVIGSARRRRRRARPRRRRCASPPAIDTTGGPARARHRDAHDRPRRPLSRSASQPGPAERSESPTGAERTRSPSASWSCARKRSRASR